MIIYVVGGFLIHLKPYFVGQVEMLMFISSY